ncbi:MAG: phosphatidylglycerol lysyltransferase domain-containing protein [Paludibacteraceae bacterium]|nr:phosphatidylglycerol lysyltransferase domain-containing protein [Paludibacteraceae bacterium]
MDNKIRSIFSLKKIEKGKFGFIYENWKQIVQFIIASFFVALGIWFFNHQQAEFGQIENTLKCSKPGYLVLGGLLVIVYIYLQGLMYQTSFGAVNKKVSILSTVILFLKRNFISVFIPAGGVTSLAFFTGAIEKKGISKTKIHFASSIYAFVGILSVIIIAVPIFIYALFMGFKSSNEWIALISVSLGLGLLFFVYKSITGKGYMYKLLVRFFPSSEVFLEDMSSHTIDTKSILYTILISILIDFTGVAHIYVSMLALGFHTSLFAASMVYLTAVIFLLVSPFMRGLGAIEVSMAFVLTQLGYSSIEAISITFLYRFFEFWSPLLIGALSFLTKLNKIFMRIVPALLILALGIINIISVLTPAIADRLERLQDFVPTGAILASNYFVLLAGIFLILTATFMLKGLKNAWWIALFLSIISLVGHLTKAIDYEEASVALLVIVMLIYSRKEYYIKTNPFLRYVGIWTALISILAVFLYGSIGFYFLDKSHLNIDFNMWQSVKYTFEHFFQIETPELVPHDKFTSGFLLSINISGILSMSFLFYTMIWPYVMKKFVDTEKIAKAKEFIKKYGKSGLDYFKTYQDKMIFLPDGVNAFIAYKIANNFAVVLETPVAENEEQMKICIRLFDKYCYNNGLKCIYFRVPESSLPVFKSLKKKHLFLGQEGVIDLDTFTLQGTCRKSLRNAVNKMVDKGYTVSVQTPPIKDGLLQKLKAVSDEWLTYNKRKEIVFSQGMFVWEELKQQTVLVVENTEEKIVGFLNIIPDYAPDEATYDLIRKAEDAPGGVIDFMLIELFKYTQSQGKKYLNVGFAPLSGMESPQNLPEKSMNFAYHKIQSFSQYKGLREYKEKFDPEWNNMYLIYEHDFDLLQIPIALSKVIKP